MSVINCKGLSKKYDDFLALNNVDLEIEEGEFYSALGGDLGNKINDENKYTFTA